MKDCSGDIPLDLEVYRFWVALEEVGRVGVADVGTRQGKSTEEAGMTCDSLEVGSTCESLEARPSACRQEVAH